MDSFVLRTGIAVIVAIALVPAAGPAAADHQQDVGYIQSGVSSEDEAKSYPCPKTQAGGWERVGPVVCLEKKAATWDISYEADPRGCQMYSTGWQGHCIFSSDMKDHVRVWGTRGILYTKFTLLWLHDGQTPAPDPPRQGAGSGSSGSSGSSGGTGSPAATPRGSAGGQSGGFTPPEPPGAPDAPDRPDGPDRADAPGAPQAPGAPDAPTAPDGSFGNDFPVDAPVGPEAADLVAQDAADDPDSAGSSRAAAAAGVVAALAALGGGAFWWRRRTTGGDAA